MITIIAGGRHYFFTDVDYARLDGLRLTLPITRVSTGRASGADEGGEQWAISRGLPVDPYPADWDDLDAPNARIKTRPNGTKYNANAGFDRNEVMAVKSKAVVLFPGGPGTADMARRAKLHGLRIIDWRNL